MDPNNIIHVLWCNVLILPTPSFTKHCIPEHLQQLQASFTFVVQLMNVVSMKQPERKSQVWVWIHDTKWNKCFGPVNSTPVSHLTWLNSLTRDIIHC
jgi:hypothetical protein